MEKPQKEQAVWHFGNCNCFSSNYGNTLEERFSLRFWLLCRYHWIDRACEFHPNVFIGNIWRRDKRKKYYNFWYFPSIVRVQSWSNAHGINVIRGMFWVQCKLSSTDNLWQCPLPQKHNNNCLNSGSSKVQARNIKITLTVSKVHAFIHVGRR